VEAECLLKDWPLLISRLRSNVFTLPTPQWLPLWVRCWAKGKAEARCWFMSACVVTTQLVITLIASCAGRKAGSWGRKPLLLIAFECWPARAVLYTLTHHTIALVAIQILTAWGRVYLALSRSW